MTAREEIHGHTLELIDEADGPQLRLDGETLRYGRLPGGLYFLHDYAYDWTDDLLELGRRYVDYRTKSDEILRQRQRRDEAGSQ